MSYSEFLNWIAYLKIEANPESIKPAIELTGKEHKELFKGFFGVK